MILTDPRGGTRLSIPMAAPSHPSPADAAAAATAAAQAALQPAPAPDAQPQPSPPHPGGARARITAEDLYAAALNTTSGRGARAATCTLLPPQVTLAWTALVGTLAAEAKAAGAQCIGTATTSDEYERALAVLVLAPRIFLYRTRGGFKESCKLATKLFACANSQHQREAELAAYVGDVVPTAQPFAGGARNRVAVAERFVREGLLGKAVGALSGTQLPRLDLSQPTNTAPLDDLYPQGAQAGAAPTFTPDVAEKEPSPAPHDEYVRLLSKFKNRTAPGYDGWTKELLMPVLKANAAAAVAVVALVYDIQRGVIPDNLSSFLRNIRGCALDRGVIENKQKIRAYGMFSTFVKLAWKVLLHGLPLDKILPPWQYGASQKFGAQRCAQWVQNQMGTGRAVVVGDAINGYGTVTREAMIAAVQDEPRLHGLVQMMRKFYTVDPLVLTFLGPASASGRNQHVVRVSSGTMIGDVAAAPLYMLAVAHAMKDAPPSLTNNIAAYVDDFAVSEDPGDDSGANIAANTLQADQWLQRSKQVVFLSKVKALSSKQQLVDICGKQHNSTYSTTHLGAPVMYYDKTNLPRLRDTKFYTKNVVGFTDNIDELQKQSAWLLFNHIIASSRYLFQATQPQAAQDIYSDLREFARNTISKIINLNAKEKLDDARLQLAMTPIADGGLGVVDAPKLGPTWHASIKHDSKATRKKMEQARTAETTAALFNYDVPVSDDTKLMWQLRKLRNAAMACFCRCSYLTTIPTHRRLIINNRAIVMQLCLHLLVIAIPEPFCLATGKPPDFTDNKTHPMFHPHVCAKCSHPATTHRHDALQRVLIAAAEAHDIHFTSVPHGMTRAHANPDIQISELHGAHCADLTVANPLGVAYDSKQPDINVMHLRATTKLNHYKEWRALTGMDVVPLVFSTLGFASSEVRQWATKLQATKGFATRLCSWASAAIVNENGKIYSNYISMMRDRRTVVTSATVGQPLCAARDNVAGSGHSQQQDDDDELGGGGGGKHDDESNLDQD